MAEPCDCRSYNREVGTVPSVVLDKPDWAAYRSGTGISIDACIAPVVKALWDAGHVTRSSCCGHAGRVLSGSPELVLGEEECDFDAIRAVIASVDSRGFTLYQWQKEGGWQLVDVSGADHETDEGCCEEHYPSTARFDRRPASALLSETAAGRSATTGRTHE